MDKNEIIDTGTECATPQKPKRKWPRRLLISVGVILLVLVLTVAGVIIWLGPIAEYVVEKHDKELVGRRLQMDNLRIKLFKGELSVDSLRLYEADDSTEFASINRLETSIELRDIFDNQVHLSRIAVTEPSAAIIQHDSLFNFDDMLAFIDATYTSSEPEPEPEPESKSWGVCLKNITIDGGHVVYVDKKLDQAWIVSNLALKSDSILLKNAMTYVDASMNINRQAHLTGRLGLNIESLDYEFEGRLERFALDDIYKYIVPVVNLSELYGELNTELAASGNLGTFTSSDMSGVISVNSLQLTGCDGGEVLSADNLTADINELNLDKQRYIFDSLTASGYSTQFIMRKDGTTNFDGLFYEEPEVSLETTSESVGDHIYDQRERVTITTDESVAPFSGMTLIIGNLNLSNGYVYFVDKTMEKEFQYKLQNISIYSNNFNIAAHNKLTIKANTNNQGSALLHWEGSLNDFYNQSILASLSNVSMEDFTPYLEHFTAFPVTSGNLTFRSQNVVTNGELKGMNRLGTYDFSVGKKDKSLDPEYNLPLKLGVYVLTDKDKHIDIDLPITGRIDSPEFSYRKVIFKAIGNLLLKIVASPFSWMSPDKQEVFRHIDINLLEPSLTSEQYARIDKMAEALKEDESLKVRLTESINYERASREIADLNLKMAYYNSTQTDTDKRLDMLDLVRINEMRLSHKEVSEFADSQLIARGIDPSHLTSLAKAKALYGELVDRQITMLCSVRNKIITDYIGFQHKEITADRFMVETMTIDQMKSYNGKQRLNVTLIIDDEEVNINADEDASEEATADVEGDSAGDLENNSTSDTPDNNPPTDALKGDEQEGTEQEGTEQSDAEQGGAEQDDAE